MSERKNIPAFASEAEEAAWWYDNREAHDNAFADAIESGQARKSTLAQRLAEAKSIQLDAEDEALAIALAKQRGVEYRAFVKALVHDALQRSDVAA